jgi:uncharacterized protein (DUF4415 family)
MKKNAKKKSVSSPREKRIAASALFTPPLTKDQRAQLEKVAQQPDSQIDFRDAPRTRNAPGDLAMGRFYRPIKEQISIRLDADVLAWFRSRGSKYQSYINHVLRQEMQNGAKGS